MELTLSEGLKEKLGLPKGAGIGAFIELITKYPAIALKKITHLEDNAVVIAPPNLSGGEYAITLPIVTVGEPHHYGKTNIPVGGFKFEFRKPAKTIHINADAVAGQQFYISFNGTQKLRFTDSCCVSDLTGVKYLWVFSVAGAVNIGILTIE